MADVKTYQSLSRQERQKRYFSEEFKRKKVVELESHRTTVQEISREYRVTRASVYKWLDKYSHMRKKGQRLVLEHQSDTRKLLNLQEEIKELERLIGQKQVKLDFLEKMIDLAEAEYGIDIKKKFSGKPSNGSGSTGKRTKRK
jgi:transposase